MPTPERSRAALRRTALVGLMLAAAGCRSPDPRYYALQPVPGAAAKTGVASLVVGPVTVPALVDRPQLVIATDGNEVQIDEFSRWAAPLADQIAGTLVTNLAQRLDGAEVWAFGQGRTDADARAAVIVQRFELGPGGQVRLDVSWTVQRKGGPMRSGRSALRETTAGGAEAAVGAQNRALGRLADDIAAAVRLP